MIYMIDLGEVFKEVSRSLKLEERSVAWKYKSGSYQHLGRFKS